MLDQLLQLFAGGEGYLPSLNYGKRVPVDVAEDKDPDAIALVRRGHPGPWGGGLWVQGSSSVQCTVYVGIPDSRAMVSVILVPLELFFRNPMHMST